MADDSKQLVRGEASIQTRDVTSSTIVVEVSDTVVTTTSPVFNRASGSCPTQVTSPIEPGPDIDTLESRQFFRTRDFVNQVFADESLQTQLNPLLNSMGIETVLVPGDLYHLVSQQTYTDTEDAPSLLNIENSSSFLNQNTPSSQASFEASGLPYQESSLLFTGSEWYEVEFSDLKPSLPEQEDFVVSLGVSFSTTSGTQTLFAQYLNQVGNGSFLIEYNSTLRVQLASEGVIGAVTLDGGTLTVDTLYFIQVARRDNTFELYLDGVIVDSITEGSSRRILQTGNLIAARTSGNISYDDSPTSFFSGKLGYVSIFTNSIPSSEAQLSEFETHHFTGTDFNFNDRHLVNWFDISVSPGIIGNGNFTDWNDLVGEAFIEYRSNSATYRPTYIPNNFNGYPVLDFNGSNQHMLVRNFVPQLLSNQQFTIGMCVRFDSSSGSSEYFSAFNDDTSDLLFLGYNPATSRIFINDSGTTSSSTNTFPVGTFYRIVWTLNLATGTVEVWVNENLEITATVTNLPKASSTYGIAAEHTSTTPQNPLHGAITFHAAASSSDSKYRELFSSYMIGTFFKPQDLDTIFAVYSAREPGGSPANGSALATLTDLSSNTNNATQGSGALQPTYTENSLNGYPGITFSGAQRLEISTVLGNTSGSDLTALVLSTNASTQGSLLSTEDASNQGFDFGYGATGHLSYEHGGATPIDSEDLRPQSPEVLAFARQSLEVSLEQNGRFVENTTLTAFTPSTETVTYLGGNPNSTSFTGDIHEVAIFESRLTEAQGRGVASYFARSYELYRPSKPSLAPATVRFEWDIREETGYVDGNTLTTLVDLSGSGNNATQSTSSARATYQTGRVGTFPALYFDGGDCYTTSIAPDTGTDPLTCFVVVSPLSTASNDSRMYFHWGGNYNSDFNETFGAGFDAVSGLNYNYNNAKEIFIEPYKPSFRVYAFVWDGESLSTYSNSKLVSKRRILLNLGLTNNFTVGGVDNGSSFLRLKGWLCHMTLAQGSLTQKQVVDYSHYLQKRFRIL